MPMMTCIRDYTLRTTTGHVIGFKAGEPTYVPYDCVDAALAVNIIPAQGGYAERKDEKIMGPARIAAMSPEMREAILLHTIDELVREGETSAFDGGGKPKAGALKERSGFEVTATERTKLYDMYRDLKASSSDLPKPDNLDAVMNVQACHDKSGLLSYLQAFGGDPKSVEGWTLKEIKSAAIVAALKRKPKAQMTDSPDNGKLDEPLDD